MKQEKQRIYVDPSFKQYLDEYMLSINGGKKRRKVKTVEATRSLAFLLKGGVLVVQKKEKPVNRSQRPMFDF